jgi:transcription-repair coupling factor (superfamily II helicase)
MEGLTDAPKAALLKLLQERNSKNILVLTAEIRSSKVIDNASFFDLKNVVEFPPWETLPGEEIAPSLDIVGKRLETLHHLLTSKKPSVVICSLQALLQKVPSPLFFKPLCKWWTVGDEIPFSSLASLLQELGYRRATVVADKGEFAVRGGIIDIFPVSAPEPYRIEFFGDTIDSIRSFDPIGQKSIVKVKQFFLSPAQEAALMSRDQNTTTLLAYLGPCTVVFDHLLELEDRWVALQKLPGIKSSTMISFSDLLKETAQHQTLFWSDKPIEELSDVRLSKKTGRAFYTGKNPLQPLSFECFGASFETARWNHPFTAVALDRPDLDIQFVCEHEAEEQMIRKEFPKASHFIKGYLSGGFGLADSTTMIVPITELTQRQKVRRERWRSTYHTPPSDFHELSSGDLVVHFNHGIGKYLGMEKRPNHQGIETEYLLLEYAEKSRLYVPVSQAYLVSRYIGTKEEAPAFHTLGTKNWQRAKASAQKAIVGYAQDLLRIGAERAVHGGFVYPNDGSDMMQFEEEFPYPETEDQLRAIFDIKQDMQSDKAMDRLLCGDVGYGKTEVAMRAAFKAAVDGKKQVAVLVPTTVLALQHYQTFCERMENHPVIVKAISRFHSNKEVKKILEEVEEGKVDILIGTHRLLSKDVKFKNLGLIIIDEEQRFGVRSKEHLKALKTGVDCLTLTATPIPRTLYLSLLGAREISLINTPPQDRLPIKTILIDRDPAAITSAMLRELSRDGQVYFIHNRVESIYLVSDELKKLLPQAKIVTGHGQMSGDELDTVFHAFKSGAADVLVATTIVENGIDIPNANTILIDRADQFGLSDLYQLRGRVGRWNRPAYAYFLVPRLRELPEIARKRLYALLESQGYGGGMKIAMRDLEIRGAGDILGTEQSGQVSTIGFHLYCKLLKRAVEALKKKQEPSFFETKMEFPYDARLPEEYIPETSLRLEMYHRLGDTSSPDEVDALFHELKDRFGAPPIPVLWLYHMTRLRTVAALYRYSLLKFNSRTLETEQHTHRGPVKKLHSLKPFKSPAELEQHVLEILSQRPL